MGFWVEWEKRSSCRSIQREGRDYNMKVVLIGTMYPPYAFGGAEKAIATLAEALVRAGVKVVVVTLHSGAMEEIEERNGIRIYHLPLDNIYWPFTQQIKPNALLRTVWHLREVWNGKAAGRVGRILDLEAPEVVHTHNINGFSVAIWRAVKRRGIRLVHTLHDYYLLCPRTTLYRRGEVCENRCIGCQLLTANRKAASWMPDEIVSVSGFALAKHKHFGYFPDVRSRVIDNIHPINAPAVRVESPRQESHVLRFGFIGRIEPEKGIETLLRATRQLIQPEWRLRIAGKGTEGYVTSLRGEYPDDRIEWLGFTTAPSFYGSVDVVVIPSHWDEPLGYVCVESLHEGKPIICARAGGLPEIARLSNVVEHFQAGSAEELARLMNAALSDPIKWRRNLLPASAALDRFTGQAVVAKYLAVYRSEAEPVTLTREESRKTIAHRSELGA
jgi:glycosyltransferase involved in cell wall biosynthesis